MQKSRRKKNPNLNESLTRRLITNGKFMFDTHVYMINPFSISLNKNICLGFNFLRHNLFKTPSPTSTRSGFCNGCIQIGQKLTTPDTPKQFSTLAMRLAFSSVPTIFMENDKNSTIKDRRSWYI
ncbi:hypothetical protein DERF_014868 [Dermatophagoides farinae]|uniref:Uncharacterized protein n=1 Tax=Dermatophagoides farinae TaxID=6954 RepID=A0A922L1P2_DERFA|nr:hypothetical protein DERF_014868 [Dermatophagoides farinae]